MRLQLGMGSLVRPENLGPGRAGLACQPRFGPDFGARTSGQARTCRKLDLSVVRAVLVGVG
jgi:hypothetical protein